MDDKDPFVIHSRWIQCRVVDMQTNNRIDDNDHNRTPNHFVIRLSQHVDDNTPPAWTCSVASKSCLFRSIAHTWCGLTKNKNKIRAVNTLSHALTATRIGTPRCGRHDRHSDKRLSSPFGISGAKRIGGSKTVHTVPSQEQSAHDCSSCQGMADLVLITIDQTAEQGFWFWPRPPKTRKDDALSNERQRQNGPIRSDPIRSDLNEL